MLSYYEFKQMPFEKAISPQSLYITGSHEEAISRLEYAIQGNRFAVLTGDSGSGKSTLLRHMVEKTDKNKYPVYYCFFRDFEVFKDCVVVETSRG